MRFGFRKIDGVEAAILPEILNRDLRAELRLDAMRGIADAIPHPITLRRRLATGLAHPARAFGGPSYGPL